MTGAGGFVGAHLAARLVADGWDVVAAVRPGGSVLRLHGLAVEVVPLDLADPAALAAGVGQARPDVAFHLAAARASASAPKVR